MVATVDIHEESHKDCSDIKLITTGWPATPYWWKPSYDYCDRDIDLIKDLWFEMLSSIEELDDLQEPYVVREIERYSEILLDESVQVEDPDHMWFEYYVHEEYDKFNPKACYLLGRVIFHIIAVLNLKWVYLFREEIWENYPDAVDEDVTWDEFKHDSPDKLTAWENKHDLDTPNNRVDFYQSEMTRIGL